MFLKSAKIFSVHQFAFDNDVFFEFHSSFFIIKDCKTKLPIHHGPLKDGLYHLFPPQVPSSTLGLAILTRPANPTRTRHEYIGFGFRQ
jgi:hypothetical protein